jgi:hypothetical protein
LPHLTLPSLLEIDQSLSPVSLNGSSASMSTEVATFSTVVWLSVLLSLPVARTHSSMSVLSGGVVYVAFVAPPIGLDVSPLLPAYH